MAENENATTTTTTEAEVDYKAKFESLQTDFAKLKESFDKASSDVADYKRKERDRMTEEEKSKADNEAREKHYKELERRIAISDYESTLDDVTDAKARREIAELFADGKLVDAMNKHKEYRAKDRTEMEKRIKADLMKTNPGSTASSGTSAKMTKAEIMAVKDANERQRLIAENITLFQ